MTQDTKIYRVGILCGNDLVYSTITGFKAKMDELGYHEGQNILYDIQKTNFDQASEKHIIERFVGEKVDLIFAFPHDTSLTAKNITQGTDMPVIFAYANIEDINFVNSLREPGGNITGVQHQLDKLTVKRLEFLLDFDPNIQTIWVAYDNETTVFPSALKALRLVAQSKHVKINEVFVSNLDEIKADLEAREKMADIGIDAILIMPDQLIQTRESWVVIRNFAQKHNLPISANVYSQMTDGAIFHYGNDYIEVGTKAATLANKILQGVPPSELPVLSPEEYLRINLVAAETLGLSVPEGLLKNAVEIIRQ
ncbi:MAG: ABC transporter substrate-binding protein [Anaerolineales bacterium]|nr:ABC transporter substrate-binding protein [Anaerolineales bacterium]